MKAWYVTGSKEEIADSVARIQGEVREAIVFIDEPVPSEASSSANGEIKDIFAEMDTCTIRRGNVDDSRDALYCRMENE